MKVDLVPGPRLGSARHRWVGATALRHTGSAVVVLLVSAAVSFFTVSRSTPEASRSQPFARLATPDAGARATRMPSVAFERLGAVARRAGRAVTRGGPRRPGAGATPADPHINRTVRLRPPTPAVAIAAPVATSSVDGPAAKLDQALRRLTAGDPARSVRVIVQAEPGQAAAVAEAVIGAGRPVRAAHTRLGAFTATLAAGELLSLAARGDVSRVSVDAVVRSSSTSYDYTDGTVLKDTLGLEKNGGVTGGDTSWAGAGVGVAIIDSGISDSADLATSRIIAFFDLIADDPTLQPYDDYGHGTHVAGLIGGSGKHSDDLYAGAAALADLIIFKVLDRYGEGYTSDVISALALAVEQRDALGVDVINLSLGYPIFEPAVSDPLVRAVEDAVAAGIVVVVSAGNYGRDPETGEVGYAGITSPGNAPSAITVGALDTANTVTRADDFVQSYSSRGPTWYDAYAKLDLVAPGHRLVASLARHSALDTDHPEPLVIATNQESKKKRAPARYLRLSGTSMAAAVTTGVVAMLLETSRGIRLTAAHRAGPP